MALSFTALGSDADVPANTLTYSLDAGAPQGAAVDSHSGVFSWTPSEDQGPGDYTLTLRVTDDGIPALSASRTFHVHVNEVNLPPVLSAVPNKSVNEGALLKFTAVATDPDLPANTIKYFLMNGAPA